MTSSDFGIYPTNEATANWNKAYGDRDNDTLSALLAPTVVLHPDGAAIKDTIRGKAAAQAFLARELDAFNGGEHRVLASTACDEWKSSFTFYLDTEMWFLTQPPSQLDHKGTSEAEECEHHKKVMPDQGGRTFDPAAFQGPMQSVNADRAKARYKVAKRYAEVWERMDNTLTADTVAKDLIWWDLTTGSSFEGVDKLNSMLNDMSKVKDMEMQCQASQVLPCADQDKAFTRWSVTTRQPSRPDSERTSFGLNVLKIKDEKITEIVGFHAPHTS